MENQQANTKTLSKYDVLSLRQFPRKFFDVSIDNLKGFSEEKKQVINAINNNQSLFIYGECGTGKTHLAIAATKLYIAKNSIKKISAYPYFVSAVDIFSEIRDSFDSGVLEKDIRDKYLSPTVLVYDDMGKEKITEWTNEITFTIIDKRYRENKPIFVTSNLTLDEIKNKMGDSISSRLVELGCIIEMKGLDWRVREKNGLS